MSKFNAAIPRRVYYSDQVTDPERCPECGKPLERDHQTYLLEIRNVAGDIESFLTSIAAGAFCASCPVVVLARDKVESIVQHAGERFLPGKQRLEFVVLGLVDLDAIPPEKRDIPLGDDDNPIPLVRFLPDLAHRPPKRSGPNIPKHKKRKGWV